MTSRRTGGRGRASGIAEGPGPQGLETVILLGLPFEAIFPARGAGQTSVMRRKQGGTKEITPWPQAITGPVGSMNCQLETLSYRGGFSSLQTAQERAEDVFGNLTTSRRDDPVLPSDTVRQV